jgi:excisionase family DNA binding protein
MTTAKKPKKSKPKKYDPKAPRQQRSKPPAVLDGYLTRHEVATLLRCSVQKIDKYIAKGILKAYQFGRNILLKRAEVMAVVEAQPL